VRGSQALIRVEVSSQRLNFRQNVGSALTIEHPDHRHRRLLRARRERPRCRRAAESGQQFPLRGSRRGRGGCRAPALTDRRPGRAPACFKESSALPSPTLRERRHRGLARHSVRRRAVLLIPEGSSFHSPHGRDADPPRLRKRDSRRWRVRMKRPAVSAFGQTGH
jgi:hypothetical protein